MSATYETHQKEYLTVRDLCKAAELNTHKVWKIVEADKLTVCIPLHATLATPYRADADRTTALAEADIVSLTGPGYLDDHDLEALRTHTRGSHDIHHLTHNRQRYDLAAIAEITEQDIVYGRSHMNLSIRDIRIHRDEFERFVRGMSRFLE